MTLDESINRAQIIISTHFILQLLFQELDFFKRGKNVIPIITQEYIESLIKDCDEKAKSDIPIVSSEEYKQISEWLRDLLNRRKNYIRLKDYRKSLEEKYNVQMSYNGNYDLDDYIDEVEKKFLNDLRDKVYGI